MSEQLITAVAREALASFCARARLRVVRPLIATRRGLLCARQGSLPCSESLLLAGQDLGRHFGRSTQWPVSK